MEFDADGNGHLLGGQYKRFCIRNVLKTWLGYEATDDFIWEVCHFSEQEGWNELQAPSLYPLKHRELLRAIVAVRLGISDQSGEDYDELLVEQKGRVIWIHFAVRPSGNRRRTNFRR